MPDMRSVIARKLVFRLDARRGVRDTEQALKQLVPPWQGTPF